MFLRSAIQINILCSTMPFIKFGKINCHKILIIPDQVRLKQQAHKSILNTAMVFYCIGIQLFILEEGCVIFTNVLNILPFFQVSRCFRIKVLLSINKKLLYVQTSTNSKFHPIPLQEFFIFWLLQEPFYCLCYV